MRFVAAGKLYINIGDEVNGESYVWVPCERK